MTRIGIWFIGLVVLGALVRIASIGWNDRLHGDVNLLALTAREFVESGRLAYPMKTQFDDMFEYLDLVTPASQHPPVWPLSAGVIGKLVGSDETYPIMQFMCFVVGMAMLASVARYGHRSSQPLAWGVALGLMALSPILVDYSANGSMYIVSAAVLLFAALFLSKSDPSSAWQAALIGAICSLAYQTHGAVVLLTVVFGIHYLWSKQWRSLVAYVAAGVGVALPWMLWNIHHFGRPIYSTFTDYLPRLLGRISERVVGGRIVEQTEPYTFADIGGYVELVTASFSDFFETGVDELGPFALVLMGMGIFSVWRSSPRGFRAGAWVYGGYLVVILFWGKFKANRFLTPILPAALLLAGMGLAWGVSRGGRAAVVSWLCLVGTIAWMIPAYLEDPPVRYYPPKPSRGERYEEMRTLALRAANFEEGVMLGLSKSLDGGIETVYWTRLPYVSARLAGVDLSQPGPELGRLVHDFDVRYVWVDDFTRERVLSDLPRSSIRDENGAFAIIEVAGFGALKD
jgi:hypothetical protein